MKQVFIVQVTIITLKCQSAGDIQSHSWHMKVLDFSPFCGLYVREFELLHSNLVNRSIKITHAHNLHRRMLDFAPVKECIIIVYEITLLKRISQITSFSGLL